MPIVYAAVAEDGQVTTECQLAGNKTDFSKVITVLLERMEHRNHKKSYSHEGYLLPQVRPCFFSLYSISLLSGFCE
jgi:hypothetical protein